MEAQSIRRVLVDMFVRVDRTKYVLLVVSIRPIVFTNLPTTICSRMLKLKVLFKRFLRHIFVYDGETK